VAHITLIRITRQGHSIALPGTVANILCIIA